jgi:hypothetical protein
MQRFQRVASCRKLVPEGENQSHFFDTWEAILHSHHPNSPLSKNFRDPNATENAHHIASHNIGGTNPDVAQLVKK